MPRHRWLHSLTLLFAAGSATADLYLMFNVGDGEDRLATDAGTRYADALDGQSPTVIDARAPKYYVKLNETLGALGGVGQPVGAPAQAATASESVSGSAAASASLADAAAAPAVPPAPTDAWVEYRASVVSLFLFSPDGTETESDVRYEPARLFVKGMGDGVVIMITNDPAETP